MEDSLENLFDGEEPEVPQEPAEAPEETAEETPGVTGEEVDAPPASKPDEKPPENYVPQAALADERAKRQEYERQLAEMRGRLDQLTQSTSPEKPEEQVNFFDDPDKFMAQFQSVTEQKIAAVERKASLQVLNALEAAAKTRHDDFDAAAAAFAQRAQGNTALQQEAAAAPDPAEFVYQAGKRLLMLDEGGGDLETLIQKEREKAVAEYLQANPTPGTKAASVPKSLSTVTGAPSKPIAEDDAFETIFPNLV